ncbi:helix-turn-helix domain-containing protein [Rathayibacter sp. VKM Ac-2856]|uniref:IclR family transcriptional regulator domain-containing protein n=1 Tax=unclassified Rathayibacter TaxID=2609250 RepID=UPI0015650655|nr:MULTISPECIES: helix-turn-helix domain-containing protein [unclassified Rathayibacter]NQX05191.1 helix-turn-helix domain-containing protein [Rathayibacter sp. VKM Ac-2858]NQX20358.1 helix-turn-helix domain-containing protein [Rathayibacter sp. VKM Ac-2856]
MSARVTTGLRVVRLLGERPDPTAPLGVGVIAAALGAPLSSVSRMCAELERTGLIERGADYGSYRLGAVAVRLSGRAAAPVARSLRFALTLAAQQTGETVVLAAGAPGAMRVIGSVLSSWTLHSPAAVGERIDDADSAIARAADPQDLGDDTVVETAEGLRVEIATPLLTPAGECAAVLAVRLPAVRLRENGPRIRRALAVARRSIEAALGAERMRGADEPQVLADAAAAAADGARTDGAPAATPPTGGSGGSGASALHAVLPLLQHLADGPDTVAGAARATGLRRDRTGRLLDACVAAGVVERGADGEFRVAWVVHGWFRAAAAPLIVSRGGPLVAEAARSLRACAFVTVLAGMRSLTLVEELSVLDGSLAGDGLAMLPWLGRAHPIVGSDGGPTMLMDLEPDELAQLFPARHTPRELARFVRRVQTVRRDGVLSMQAYDDAGMVSISAPIRDASGAVVAAACLVGMADDVTARSRELERAAIRLAEAVSAVLR